MKMEPGRGSVYRARRRIVVSFAPDEFEKIRAMAVKNKLAMGEQIRTLACRGIESAETEKGGMESCALRPLKRVEI